MIERSFSPEVPIPEVRRARGCRLYTADGGRFVDLWQDGGAAILGRSAPGLLTVLKDTASRGLLSPLPHPSGRRFESALARLFPGSAFRVYADSCAADAALSGAGYDSRGLAGFSDPAMADSALGDSGPEDASDKGPCSLWRPWLDAVPDPAAHRILSPVLPLPWPCRPIVLVLAPGDAGAFPPSDLLAPVVLAGAARAVHDLAAALPVRRLRAFRSIETVLSASPWARNGVYLRLRDPRDAERYDAYFGYFLSAGFLLPPRPSSPLILPAELSPGEAASLARALSFRP